MQKSGFSLIELMVIISIVGILSAVAIPNYLNYIATAKFSKHFTMAYNLLDRANIHVSQYGVFPDASDLRSGSGNTLDGSFFSPGYYAAEINNACSVSSSPNCTANGLVGFSVDNSNPRYVLQGTCYSWYDENRIFQKGCAYYFWPPFNGMGDVIVDDAYGNLNEAALYMNNPNNDTAINEMMNNFANSHAP